jgi:hypothetical protein
MGLQIARRLAMSEEGSTKLKGTHLSGVDHCRDVDDRFAISHAHLHDDHGTHSLPVPSGKRPWARYRPTFSNSGASEMV